MAPTKPTAAGICEISTVDGCVRASVGRGHAHEIQECYGDWARACLSGGARCGLLVGASDGDAFVHLAARDAIASMALAGLPSGFRIAVIALNAPLIAIYDTVVVAALRRGIEARRFQDEASASAWLSPQLHQ